MGNYFETFDPPFVLTRIGPVLPDYQKVYAFAEETRAADERLTADVWKRLSTLAGAIALGRVDVSVERGFVTLTGEVDDAEARDAVERFTNNTIGVRGVTNRLVVQSTSETNSSIR